LHPGNRYVFPNLGTWKKHCWHYFVTDVVGLEGRAIDLPRLRYSRTLAYQKPTLRLDYMVLGTRETALATREGLELFFKRCALYGIYPSVGRYCDKVYEKFPELYKTYMPVIRQLGAAGWEPVTHAASEDPEVEIERFGPRGGKLFLAVYNRSKETRQVRLTVDTDALGLKAVSAMTELLSGKGLPPAKHVALSLPGDGLQVLALSVR